MRHPAKHQPEPDCSALLDEVCERVPAGVAVLDTALRFLRVNRMLAESNGVPVEAHLGRTVCEVLPGPGAAIEALMRRVLDSGEAVIEAPVSGETLAAPGRRRSWLASYYPRQDADGRISGILAIVRDVTEQRDTLELALKLAQDSASRLRRVLDNLFSFVGMLTPDGTLIEANRAPLEAAGIAFEEVEGQKFWDCYWWSYDAAVQAQLRDAVQRAASGEVLRYDVVVRMRSDSRMAIDFMLAPLCDEAGTITHLIASAIDISERKASEMALRESEARFRQAVESAPDGLVVVNADGRMQLVNGKMEVLFGYHRDELPGQPIDMLMPERYRERHPDLMRSFFAMPSVRDMANRRELYARRKDGSEFPVEIGLNPIPTSNGQLVLASISDVTARKAAQAQIERALAEKTALLDEVHHRVKNNLQVVSSLLNLQSRNATPEAQALLAESQRRVRAMALIHQLLYERHDFSEVDLGVYLERLAALLRESMLRGRSAMRLRIDCQAPVLLDLQRAVPCGLLVNELVTNAIKHAFPGDRSGEVLVALQHDADGAGAGRIIVADDGIGLPAHLAPGEGSSIGFQLVPLLVDQLQGTLSLVREGGTRFEIVFRASKEAS